jgi:hypothetical protein
MKKQRALDDASLLLAIAIILEDVHTRWNDGVSAGTVPECLFDIPAQMSNIISDVAAHAQIIKEVYK